MFRFIIASSIVVALVTPAAFAADGDAGITAGPAAPTITLTATANPETRPAVLPVLYLSLAGLQAYDVYSTRQSLAIGAREANPLMSAAGDTTGMVILKTVSTVTTIVMAERLWRRNKAAAIVMLVVANGVMGAVAANNARVLHQIR